jgi:hypothetical protein
MVPERGVWDLVQGYAQRERLCRFLQILTPARRLASRTPVEEHNAAHRRKREHASFVGAIGLSNMGVSEKIVHGTQAFVLVIYARLTAYRVQRKRFSGWVGVGKCLSSLQEAEVCLSHPLRGLHIPKSSLCGCVQCYSDLFRASNSG